MNNAKLSIGEALKIRYQYFQSMQSFENAFRQFYFVFFRFIPFELALKINVRELNLHLNLAALLTHESSLIYFNVNGFVNKRQNYFQQIK